MNVPRVRTAIVGCGTISNIYIRNLMHLFSIIDLVAVCDIVPQAAQAKADAYGVPRVMTMEEIEADPEIELVVCLTGPAQHYAVCKRMLLAGKHVYTEKMLAATLDEGRELVALAGEKGLLLGVAPDTVLGAGVQTARKALDAGLIGEPTSCLICINKDQSLMAERFRFLRQEGGALPFDMGGYYLSAMYWLLGCVAEVCAFTAPARPHRRQFLCEAETVDSYTIPGPAIMTGALRFESGVLGSLHINGDTVMPERPKLVVYGTEGTLELGDPNYFDGKVVLSRAENEPVALPFTHGYDGTPTLPDPTPFESQYGHRGVGVAELAWSLRKGRPCRLSGEYGLHTMEILYGMIESSKSGRSVSVASRFQLRPLPSGYYSTMFGKAARADAELSLVD